MAKVGMEEASVEAKVAPTSGEETEEDFQPFNNDEDEDDVTLQEGGRHLMRSMSHWFIPRNDTDGSSVTSPTNLRGMHGTGGTVGAGGLVSPGGHQEHSFKIDVTFENAEINVKRDLKRQYLALAIGCWIFLTVTQTLSLVFLNYWEYSPVVIGIIIIALSTVFYWRYVWRELQLPFRRLWETPYPYAVTAAVLGSLSQHAMFLVYEGYDIGQLLIVFFLIQAFYIILVASTFRNYMSKWQKFINHRKLCFDALQVGLAKQARDAALEEEAVPIAPVTNLDQDYY